MRRIDARGISLLQSDELWDSKVKTRIRVNGKVKREEANECSEKSDEKEFRKGIYIL